MAIVILVSKTVGDDEVHQYGGVECDVEGCETTVKYEEGQPSLLDRGWFIAPGRHRCPEHTHIDAPGRDPLHRYVGGQTKKL